jgi:hypothetical protein
MEAHAKLWSSIDVPLDGMVRIEVEFLWPNGFRGSGIGASPRLRIRRRHGPETEATGPRPAATRRRRIARDQTGSRRGVSDRVWSAGSAHLSWKRPCSRTGETRAPAGRSDGCARALGSPGERFRGEHPIRPHAASQLPAPRNLLEQRVPVTAHWQLGFRFNDGAASTKLDCRGLG